MAELRHLIENGETGKRRAFATRAAALAACQAWNREEEYRRGVRPWYYCH